ncbi:SDR family oxidoreductase [Roseicyclus sp. F158]|uniref:SDR family oxidoreductase n=1 Tax=Tropicimonas omnivorans TaxID=3075590 RepID=A0ABU3DKH3_9RHOB|nr:SDR family oxidoreductase [Roseicyclus sp. F158]MDT0684171.1 SDR family oxidoreductase [Roseicyclus sp. F158]
MLALSFGIRKKAGRRIDPNPATSRKTPMPTALVLGGYGLIGSACCRSLTEAGFHVVGLGRSRSAAMAAAPNQDWIFRDLSALDTEAWKEFLDGADIVVNAAGALQDGPRDDLEAIHATMLAQLCAAASPDLRFVQISAAGVSPKASTEFFRSKARGDAYVAAAPCDWVILRPSLVLASDAYGGTALLRGAAAIPGLLPEVLPDSLVQTVHIEDLAAAVVAAARGAIASGTIADITEKEARPLPELIRKIRSWQGFPESRLRVRLPNALLALTGFGADAAGHLGWRSPLRSTAIAVLRDGVRGDPGPWVAAGGILPRDLDASLAALPATRQERLYARLYFALPLAIAALSVFWIASGLVALAQHAAAASALAGGALPTWAVGTTVIGGALIDIALGIAILWRPWCKQAALGMVAVSGAYLTGGTLFAPELWIDPLGPLVKVLPSIGLAIIVWLAVESR